MVPRAQIGALHLCRKFYWTEMLTDTQGPHQQVRKCLLLAMTIKNSNFRIEFSSFDHSSKFCIQFLSQPNILAIKPVIYNCAPWNSTGTGTAGQVRGGERQ